MNVLYSRFEITFTIYTTLVVVCVYFSSDQSKRFLCSALTKIIYLVFFSLKKFSMRLFVFFLFLLSALFGFSCVKTVRIPVHASAVTETRESSILPLTSIV